MPANQSTAAAAGPAPVVRHDEHAPSLEHVRAVVTGAAGGIGRALVLGLLARGARVLAVDVDESRLRLLRDDTPAVQRPLLAAHCVDLGAPGAEGTVLAAATGSMGGVNALVCNSGLGRAIYTSDLLRRPPPVWEIGDWAWERMFLTNALSPIRLMNAAAPVLIEQGWGRVVTVTTSLDHMLAAGSGPYGPSKAALEAYTSVLAGELEDTGVTANVLVPGGVVDTPMVPDLPGVAREDMLPASIMVSPLVWLLSRMGDATSRKRILARLWDASQPPTTALAAAASPTGWWGIAAGQQRPFRGSAHG